MRRIRVVQGFSVWLAAIGMCLPGTLMAAPPAPGAVGDVALGPGGLLVGRVVDSQGAGVAGVPVSLRYQDREVVVVTTDTQGQFAVRGVHGGVHEIATPKIAGVYRLWTADAAPPSAQTRVVLAQDQVVRGQAPDPAPKGLFAHPILLAGIVATAVAVPVVLCTSHHHHPASP